MWEFCGNKVFDILPGKSAAAIVPLLKVIPGRERVQMVCMDLCPHYRSIVKSIFPNARIVADRFHVIRLLNDAFMKTWLAIDPDLRYSRQGPAKLLRKSHQRMAYGFKNFHNYRLSEERSDVTSFQRCLNGMFGCRCPAGL
ncbi:hypothetical protein EBR96_08580 [bacterium]|nr:hypothetical protein [bacterium]